LFRILGPRDDVEDVAQDVFVRVHQSLSQLRSPEVFETWLYRLTTHAAYDHLRRRMRNEQLRMSDLSEEQGRAIEAAASGSAYEIERRHKEVRELLDLMLSRLSSKDRILLLLKEVDGRSLKELSQMYGCNINAIKVRLFRARRRALTAYREARVQAGIPEPESLPLELAPSALRG
jgi:RNA polymerase sigma-70 factor (ECF subfamily)